MAKSHDDDDEFLEYDEFKYDDDDLEDDEADDDAEEAEQGEEVVEEVKPRRKTKKKAATKSKDKEKPKAKAKRKRKKKVVEAEEEYESDEEAAVDDPLAEILGETETSDDKATEASANDDEEEPEPTPEPEVPPEPDHPDAVASLKDLGVRLVNNELGNCFRIIFYEKHGDDAVAQIHGLHSLKEVWVVGSKASKQIVDQLKETMPQVTVYHD